ncbi:MAG TPA: HAMP domain-containing sensor histidine kinase [Actinomycetota bacterium]|nr:HAMP domain-containing sensor histidine kinase [Actinomycetota bacterium]
MSRAFGSSPDVGEATDAAVRWVRAAVGGDDEAVVRLFLADPTGTLYPAVPRLEAVEAPEQRAARRRILENRRAVRVPLSEGRTMVSFPLVSRGEPVGVLEVVASAASVEDRWATLDAVTSQVAIVFRNLHHRAALHSSFEGLKHMSELAGEMVRARTPEEAVRAAVRFCHERFDSPAAGWLTEADPTRLALVSARGLGTGRGAELRSRMRRLHRDDVRTETSRRALAERFANLAGEGTAEAVPAGEALLLVAGAGSTASFRLVEDLLEDVLIHLTVVSAAERRTEGLDLGLALTAHEVRGPLVGALAIIERLLLERDEDMEEHALLHRSREQLQQLAGLVDGMLRWAVAGEPLRLLPADLVTVVRESADALSQETSQGRVKVTGRRSVPVRADTDHLRSAVSNVIRNALAYSPAETTVTVAVRATDGGASVTVRDQGPGVPSSEQDSIFDPFIRGSAAQLVRTGNGLGLFIARRVMEAHGGRIWLGSSRRGSVFHLELPLAGEEAR